MNDSYIYVGGQRFEDNSKIISLAALKNELIFRVMNVENQFVETTEYPLAKKENGKIIFDEKDIERFINFVGECTKFSGDAVFETLLFANDIYKTNETVYSKIFRTEEIRNKYSYNGLSNSKVRNLVVNLITINIETMEKLISTLSNSVFYNNLVDTIMDLGEGRKMKQILQMPKRAIEALNGQYKDCMVSFQTIAKHDSNDLNIVLDYVQCFETNYYGSSSTSSLIHDIANILSMKRFNINDLLRYFNRQAYYSSFYHSGSSKLSYNIIRDISKKLVDTMNMYCDIVGSIEGFELPNDIYWEHAVTAKNYNLNKADNSDVKNLSTVLDELKILEYKGKDFSVCVPKDANDIMREGTLLRHCVASYVSKIANREAVVLFLRKNNALNTPFITLEIDEDFNFLQVKTYGDEDVVEMEIFEFLEEYRKVKETEKGVK